MIIKGQELVTYAQNFLRYEVLDGGIVFFRFTKFQLDHLKATREFCYDRAIHTVGTTLKFKTDAKSFTLSFLQQLYFYPAATFDVLCDGILTQSTTCENEKEGRITQISYEGDGKSHIYEIYFPAETQLVLKQLKLCGESYINSLPYGKINALIFGDSITQGYGCDQPSLSYANLLVREFGFNAINQGIGGYVFDSPIIDKDFPFKPDFITVALGTNDYTCTDFTQRVDSFFCRLNEVFGGIKTVVITPIWRTSCEQPAFDNAAEYIKNVCSKYKNIYTVDGTTLTPHIAEAFLDGLHPNALGDAYYAKSLEAFIKTIL